MPASNLKPPAWVKAQSTYTTDQDSAPGPRHGHWSDRSDVLPEFLGIESYVEQLHLNAWGYGRDGTVAELKEMNGSAPPPLASDGPRLGEDVVSSTLTAPARDGTPIEMCVYRSPKADAARPAATLAFKLHGGGWVVPGDNMEEHENRNLGSLPDVVLVSVHYRLAPEFPWPTALNDCWDMLNWCIKNHQDLGIDPAKIVLLGCSAGGNLAAALAIKARDAGLKGIIGQHLSISVLCHPKFFAEAERLHGPLELLSWQQNRNAPLVDAERMEAFWDLYVGTDPRPDPMHSPLLCADLKGLPPTMLQIGGYDLLRDEVIGYAEALQAAGVKVELHVYKGLAHGFFYIPDLEYSRLYHRRLREFVQQCSK